MGGFFTLREMETDTSEEVCNEQSRIEPKVVQVREVALSGQGKLH